MKYLLVMLALLSIQVRAERSTIHQAIELCAVTSDPFCLKDILHRITSLAQDGEEPLGLNLLAGNFTKTGTSNLCPQNVRFISDALVGKIRLRVTYLSPCPGAFDDMDCTGTTCTTATGNRTLAVINTTSYVYKAENGHDVFVRDGFINTRHTIGVQNSTAQN